MSAGTAYSWDQAPVEAKGIDDDSVILQPGEYRFTVRNLERGQHEPKPGGTIGACSKAMVTLEIDGGAQGKAYVRDNFYLYEGPEGSPNQMQQINMIGRFFRSVGILPPDGTRVSMADWSLVAARSGRCKTKIEEYKGSKKTRISHYLSPDAAPAPVAPPVAPPQQQQYAPPPQQYAPPPAPVAPPVQQAEIMYDANGNPVPF